MDICFIKPQDLLALSIAICAWRFAKDKRFQGLKSSKNTQHISKKGEEATKSWSREHQHEREPDRDPTIYQYA
jgi:hypothetical protein